MAGFIDADGSILIHYRRERHRLPDTVQPRVAVYQNDRSPIDFIRSFFGGHLSNVKGYWQLQIIRYADVQYCLEELLPYLRVKHRQATIALIILQYKLLYRDVCRRRGESPYKPRELELAQQLAQLQAYRKDDTFNRYRKHSVGAPI